MPDNLVVEIRGLTYEHPASPAGARGRSLDGIDLEIRPGEFVVVTGPSGCGKSTLCRCIAGLVPHADRGTMGGKVVVCGKDTRDYLPGRLAGLVALTFQSPDDQLFSNSVEAEIAFGPEHMGMEPARIDARITWALDVTGAGHLRRRLVDELSGGEKQRVAIAAALALKPSVLVLDEPTSELDPMAAEDLVAMLHRLNRERGMTVLVVEHRLDRLYGTMTRLVVLDHGKVALDGAPDDVFAQDLAGLGIAAPPLAAFRKRHGAGPYAGIWRLEPVNRTLARGRCAISLRDVEFAYRKAAGKALDGVSLDFFCGEITVIMGANGSGKTTLIKHFNGLLRPDRGEVSVDGESTASRTVAQIARKAGIVFQSPDRQLFAETVSGELAFGPANAGMTPGEIDQSVTDTASALGISPLLREPPFTLSGGEKQRVAIGSVLTLCPLALALDEPTLGLGHGMKDRLASILHSLAGTGRAIIVVTHDVEFAAEHADRIVVISRGKVAADGSPRIVLASEGLLKSASLHMPQAMALGQSLGLTGVLSVDEIVRSDL
jgi:energy-coupling factor transporter ATP-binding protein EcfA2